MNSIFDSIVLGVFFLVLVILLVVFLFEKEKQASIRMVQVMGIYVLLNSLLLALGIDLQVVSCSIIVLSSIVIVIALVPYKFSSVNIKLDEKVDERTTIFSRMFELIEDSDKKTAFYKEYPKLKLIDDEMRGLPGLLSPKSKFYDPVYYGKAKEYSKRLTKLFPKIEGIPEAAKSLDSGAKIEKEIRTVARQLGAISVGFAKLEPYHFYSRKGRGEQYGKPIQSQHNYAVAITVEMDKKAVDQAPFAPVIAESCRQYYNVGKIAIELAELIRKKGYEATAHIDANYEVICPLVARDAGLGDIGRMGLLMTPQLGPRVRLAVVSTTFELEPSEKKFSNSIQYFCRICKKCAHACPSNAIQQDDRVRNNLVRYRINHEKCYGYWAKVGTDCARCMSVCPYAHPNNAFHNLIRFGINQNPIFARLTLLADHFFYGRIPKIKRSYGK